FWSYVDDKLIAERSLVILGAPASGKTTLLKYLALHLGQPKYSRRRKRGNHAFPILLFLRDHVSAIASQSDFTLIQAIQNQMQKRRQDILSDWIISHLERGDCLVFLVGLDEVAIIALRKRVSAWIQRELYSYSNH